MFAALPAVLGAGIVFIAPIFQVRPISFFQVATRLSSCTAVFGINMIAQEALAYQRQIVNTGSQNCTGTKSGTLFITQDCMLLAGMC